jgi:hypothetical protein
MRRDYFKMMIFVSPITRRTELYRRPIWLSGGNTRLLHKGSRVRFPHSATICVHELFVLGLGVSMCDMYVFTKKMYISKFIIIRCLESITQAL